MPEVDDSFMDDWLMVDGEGFIAPRRSPNGRYTVAARDHGYADGRERFGALVLVQGRTLCFRQTVRRAINPHVRDDGVVVVEDWEDASKLEGTLRAFNVDGSSRWNLALRANIFRAGMSADGARVFVSTCNSPDPEHGGRTFLLDVSTGAVVWSRKGWGDVRFVGNQVVADVKFPGRLESFPLDEHGQLGADHAAAQERLRDEQGRGQHWWVLPRLEAALKARPVDTAVVQGLLGQVEDKTDTFPASAQAKLARCRGDFHEAQGDLARAVECWERALAIDPKATVKRRLDRARAALAQGPTR